MFVFCFVFIQHKKALAILKFQSQKISEKRTRKFFFYNKSFFINLN